MQAVQDQEYMAKFSQQSNDPFIASQEREHDGYLLLDALTREGITPSNLNEHKTYAIPTGPWERCAPGQGAQPIVGTRSESLKRAALSRISAALVAAVFLVGPMWVLVLHQEVFFQLGFTTACVLAFGMLVAWYLDTVDKVFSVTLAYAAVLMVFIGVIMEQDGNAE